jgi:V/A-type H+-transporting ATPase subunit C
VLAREYPDAKETGSFSRMENELYKQFYAEILGDAKAGIKGGASFLSYIQLEIDIKNTKTLFRLRADAQADDVRDMFIAGGTLSVVDFSSLHAIRDLNEFIDQLKANIRNDSLHTLLDEMKGKTAMHDIEVRLTRVQLEQMEKMSKRNPFSVHPVLVYLEKKKYEVFNLRALARGKESKLPSEKIAEYLVM